MLSAALLAAWTCCGLAKAALASDDVLDLAVAKGDVAEAIHAAQALVTEAAGKQPQPAVLAARLEDVAARLSQLAAPEVVAVVEPLLLRALELREAAEGKDRFEHLALLEKLSQLNFDAARWERSEAIDRRCLAIKIAKLGEDATEAAVSRRNLGLSLFNQGRLGEAEAQLRSAAAALQKDTATAPIDVAYALNDLADVLRAANRYDEATPLYEHSVAIAEKAVGASSPELVTLLSNLGGLYRDTNRYGESLWRLSQAVQIAETSAEVPARERMTLWNNLAEVNRFQGNVVEAERLYRRAIESASQVLGEDHPKLATFRNQLGELLSDVGRYPEAEALFATALANRTRALGPQHLDVAYTYRCIGRLAERMGRTVLAEDALRKALAVDEARLGPSHPEVAAALVALAAAVSPESVRAQEARRLLDRAITIFEATPADPRSFADAYAQRASLEWREGHASEARGDLAQALDILERLRPEIGGSEQTRAEAFALTLGRFHRMIGWEIAAGNIDAAFGYAERTKGRVLLDQMALAGVDLRNGIEAAERTRLDAKEAAIRQRLAEARERVKRAGEAGAGGVTAEMYQSVAAASADFLRVYEEIKNASRFWRTSRAEDGGTTTLARVQQDAVPAGGRMLFYVVGDEASVVFDIPKRPGKASVHVLEVPVSAAAVLGIAPGKLDAGRLRAALTGTDGNGLLDELASPPRPGRGRTHLETRLHALWQVLVPVAMRSQVLHSREVLVIPDGLLHEVPFEALVPEPATNSHLCRYWLDLGPPVRYAASATALSRSERAGSALRGSEAKIVSVSDPVFDIAGSPLPQLERLPGTARETVAIRRSLASSGAAPLQLEVLSGGDARESRVREALPAARFIHIATHGLVDATHHDILATLALSPSPEPHDSADDGQLQLYEIYGLDLHSEVAVLSACESRAGMVVPGEGAFALSRAFLAAGSKRVVASLWSAEDESTADIVSSFFASASGVPARPGDSYARALFAAKKKARDRPEWTDPFFWAPLVLEGAR